MYIVGYMGAGKSTSGRRLALMDLPFFDTDEALRRDSGQTVTALFDAEGRPHSASVSAPCWSP